VRFVIFSHSLVSDWNHGNAHFLRGVTSELLARGHDVTVYEPRDAWSVQNLAAECGEGAIDAYRAAYPGLTSERYDRGSFDLAAALDGADVVLVHEWSDHDLVRRVGEHRARSGGYRLLFHDTHHRSVTRREEMLAYELTHYDGVLAYGSVIRDLYLREGWAARAWTWHEAADVRVFKPLPGRPREGDVVWIGNWGDDERTEELREFLIEPVRALGLRARVHGVRYPDEAKRELAAAGIEYAGWLPNHRAPEVFARFAATVHVPRRPYVRALPGIPTIRVFEALACGIPLVSAPWDDAEGLFCPGEDFLVARDGAEMRRHLSDLVHDPAAARALAARGLATILARHTCAHRVDELLAIVDELRGDIVGVSGMRSRVSGGGRGQKHWGVAEPSQPRPDPRNPRPGTPDHSATP
jgi:spore maturation protein CgeB